MCNSYFLCILNFVFYALHYSLFILINYALFIMHCIIWNVFHVMYSMHCILFIAFNAFHSFIALLKIIGYGPKYRQISAKISVIGQYDSVNISVSIVSSIFSLGIRQCVYHVIWFSLMFEVHSVHIIFLSIAYCSKRRVRSCHKKECIFTPLELIVCLKLYYKLKMCYLNLYLYWLKWPVNRRLKANLEFPFLLLDLV